MDDVEDENFCGGHAFLQMFGRVAQGAQGRQNALIVRESGPGGGYDGLHAKNIGVRQPGRRKSKNLSRSIGGRRLLGTHREDVGAWGGRRHVDAHAGRG